MLTIYGIKNCDTMKKAFRWLDSKNIDYTFHDYKKSGITADILLSWMQEVDWQTLLNKRGTTWRKLGEDIKSIVVDSHTAAEVMSANTSLIKRPVLTENEKIVTVGFKEEEYSSLLK